jgi:hypothetical protein
LWLIKHWFSASTFVVQIATFAKLQNVVVQFTQPKVCRKIGLKNLFKRAKDFAERTHVIS